MEAQLRALSSSGVNADGSSLVGVVMRTRVATPHPSTSSLSAAASPSDASCSAGGLASPPAPLRSAKAQLALLAHCSSNDLRLFSAASSTECLPSETADPHRTPPSPPRAVVVAARHPSKQLEEAHRVLRVLPHHAQSPLLHRAIRSGGLRATC